MSAKRRALIVFLFAICLTALIAFATPSANLTSHAKTAALLQDQQIKPDVTCTATVNPVDQSFASDGGQGSFSVTIGPTCSWTATANAAWVTINSGAGIGNGTVTYTVSSNSTNSARSTTISILDTSQTVLASFTVLQGAFFADVPQNNIFFTFIGKLSARGVTTGCGLDGQGNRLYCPTANVLRQEMAAFIIRSRGEFNPPTPASQRFNDVPPSNPFYNFIDRMAALGITSGCGNGNYCPTANVLRQEMAVFIIRGIGEFNPPTPASQRFNDVPPSNPFYNFIDRMAALGITNGCSQSPPLFCPSDPVTREQMAKFLVTAFNL